MRLIAYFEKVFKNTCFEVIQRPFYYSVTRILFVCVWQSAKDPWVATYFHHKALVSILRILTKLYTFGATDRTGADRIFQNWIALMCQYYPFHIVIGVFLPWPVAILGPNLPPCASPTAIDKAVNIITRGHILEVKFKKKYCFTHSEITLNADPNGSWIS